MNRGPFWQKLEMIKRLPHEERRTAFSTLKEEVHTNEALAAKVSELLWDICSTEAPWPSPSELRAIVDEAGLPDWLRSQFMGAITTYAIRERRIQQLSVSVLNPEALYRSCFGCSPMGRVQVIISSPITITFLLFSEEDYARAYASGEPTDTAKYIQRKERSKDSTACAFSRTRLPESDHIFTAVKIPQENQHLVQSQEQELNVVTIEPDRRTIEQGVCAIEFYDWIQASLQVHRPDKKTEYGILRISKGESTPWTTVIALDGQEIGYEWNRIQRTGQELVITYRDGRPGKIIVRFDLDKDQISIRNRTPESFRIKKTQLAIRPELISPDAVQREVMHEVQHQWNKLFLPKRQEPISFASTIAAIVDGSEGDPDRGQRETLIATLRMNARSIHSGRESLRAEARGWDELLAYHRDGTFPQTTRNILKKELYNYFDSESVSVLMSLAQRYLTTYLDLYQATYQGRRPTPLSTTEIINLIQGLKGEYEHSLDQAVWALMLMLENGFHNSEVIAHLSKASLQEWPSVAIRAVKRKKAEDGSIIKK